MPAPESDNRWIDAVMWPYLRRNRRGQLVVNSNKVPLKVTWSNKRRETKDKDGNTIVLDAGALVDRRITVGSIIVRGSINDLPEGDDFSSESHELMIVADYAEAHDIKGVEVLRSVGLMRFKGALPTQVDA